MRGWSEHIHRILADQIVRGDILVEAREEVAEVDLELHGRAGLRHLAGGREQLSQFVVHRVSYFMWGWEWSVGGTKVSLIERVLVQRIRFCAAPALSLVPDARPPPNGCWPTTAPVGLSLM